LQEGAEAMGIAELIFLAAIGGGAPVLITTAQIGETPNQLKSLQ
jgi:hypothetical protein